MAQIDKILQSQGFGTRKDCQKLIHRGHVQVSGQTITDHKANFSTENFSFLVHGKEYLFREQVYIVLNKPSNYECSHTPFQHISVYDLFPDYLLNRKIQTVGRLDQDTTGLLLLTDDGQFLHSLTHPKRHVFKYYVIEAEEAISDQQLKTLENGVSLINEKGIFKAFDIQRISENSIRFAIDQGVHHQVKRMLHAVGNHVVKLHRDQISDLNLTDLNLPEGNWTYLTSDELTRLVISK